MKTVKALVLVMAAVCALSCNDGMSSVRGGSEKKAKRDRSQRTVIDSAEYVDFTVAKHNARTVRREDMLYALNGSVYKNGNSSIKVNMREGTIEINSDGGFFNGKEGCQVYGVFGLDVQAASEDCLYIRRNQRVGGFLMVDGNVYRDSAIPDLAVCLPLYGYSRNRLEVSSVMNGFIVMPSGTYWKR